MIIPTLRLSYLEIPYPREFHKRSFCLWIVYCRVRRKNGDWKFLENDGEWKGERESSYKQVFKSSKSKSGFKAKIKMVLMPEWKYFQEIYLSMSWFFSTIGHHICGAYKRHIKHKNSYLPEIKYEGTENTLKAIYLVDAKIANNLLSNMNCLKYIE